MSITFFRGLISSSVAAALLLAAWGCGDDPGADPSGPGPGPGPGANRPGRGPGPGAGPGAVDAGPLGASPTTKQIMVKLNGREPGALTKAIGKALEADSPAWETIGPQTQEYARLAAAMSKNDPTRGSKESWAKLATAFATTAEALNKAAQAKDRDAALEAHGIINGSCMECHREHRRGGPGGGGPG
ncbi:MAG: cytochrome c, partial [Isosphaerales bacterium]